MIRFSVVAFVATATVVGCAEKTDEHRGVVVRDSSGIRIVEHEGAGLPPRFQPLDIGPDYVLGLWRDADDVEQVRLYGLVKPEWD